MSRRLKALGAVVTVLGFGYGMPVSAQETHLMVVVGLGGDQEYRTLFHNWASEVISAAVQRLGVAEERIVYLGERPEEAPEVMDGRSSLETMASSLAAMAGTAGPRDRVLLLLIGHGTGQGAEAQFNLPGPDLTPENLDVMLGDFPTQMVAVVNTSPSSGPFLPVLSGPNRIIVTATRTAQERNETQFGGFFVEALKDDGSDLNKDGRISLSEAFQYARREVDRYYESQNLLATEHAQLDDDGDSQGTTDLGGEASDGLLASAFWLGSPADAVAASPGLDSISDPELIRLYGEKAELERRVMELRAIRGQMEEIRYEEELESLLVALALKTREIREKGGGS